VAAGESKIPLRDEVAALREEVRELREEVVRLRAELAPPDTGIHPAHQSPWREVIRGGDRNLHE
jgi:hypothetical protein